MVVLGNRINQSGGKTGRVITHIAGGGIEAEFSSSDANHSCRPGRAQAAVGRVKGLEDIVFTL